MINFHKKSGKPANVPAGQEHVWFSTAGLYVSNQTGTPRLITASTQTGASVPVGTPAEPNMLYYNTTNRKHYISTNDRWLEIPTGGIPGSGTGGGGGQAGNVLITDSGNWYTSNDVEGALTQIGESFPQILGTGLLPNYGGDINTINTPKEYYVTTSGTNRPSTGAGAWLITRRTTNNHTFGFYLDANGDLFTRYDSNYKKLAQDSSVTTLSTRLTDEVSRINQSMGTYKIKDLNAGSGVTLTKGSNGVYSVAVSQALQDKINRGDNGDYLFTHKFNTPTENIRIDNASTTAIYYGRDSTKANYAGFRVGSDGFGLFDYGKNRTFIRMRTEGGLEINDYGFEKKQIGTISTNYKLNFYNNRTDGGYGFEFHKRNSTGGVAYFRGAHDTETLIGQTKDWAYFDAKAVDGSAIPIRLGKINGGNAPYIQLDGETVFAGYRFAAYSGIYVGAGAGQTVNAYGSHAIPMPTPGTPKTGAKLYMFPYDHNGTTNQRNSYAALGWNARNNYITFHQARRNLSNPELMDSYAQVRVRAGGYLTVSSETKKDIIGKLETNVLDTINNVHPYIYKYKDTNTKPELGFVLERGIPEILKHGEGSDDSEKALSSYSLVAYLWKGVQELSDKVGALEQQLGAKQKTE